MRTPGGSDGDLRDLRLHVLDDLAAVGADEHHHDAGDHLATTVARDRALANEGRQMDAGDVADPHRHAVPARLDQHVADLVEALDAALAAHEELLAGANEVATPAVALLRSIALEEVVERDVQRAQPVREDLDLVGLQLAAERVDLDDAGHRSAARRRRTSRAPSAAPSASGTLGVGLAGGAHVVGAHLELEDLAPGRS